MDTWAGKCKALVNGDTRIDGWAYLVIDREQEEALQYYETDRYDVVRCDIYFEQGESMAGLIVRFVDH
jgi:hypothetical protein